MAMSITPAAGISVGSALPMGASLRGSGANFTFFSRHATSVRLEFFDRPEDQSPCRGIDLDPVRNRTGDVWHVHVEGVGSGQLYGYRVDGPWLPQEGQRFNFRRLLLDPYATAVTRSDTWDFSDAYGYDAASPERDLTRAATDNAAAMPKCVFTPEPFDWHDDQPPKHPWWKTVIYETHVRGFTVNPNSGAHNPGTYQGLIDKIPYLKDLGVTAVELMPVQEFNENLALKADKPTRNYWGYDPVVFFAPKASYSSRLAAGEQIIEFRQMIQAFHQAEIEVILDVVFNHTAEGDELGPTVSFRGIDNSIFYMLAEEKRYYRDYTGTGNTINANHPVVRDHILTALRYWVVEMHVDGFRFDLASVLGRDENGELMRNAPLLEQIAEDPILRDIKLIAEAWDAAGAYQVGSFSERRWAEWNGRFRDDVRRFWRGDDGMLGLLANRICGSSDIYAKSGKGPESSINFVTCHDGFTLNDLVSYTYKHNQANCENNNDGSNDDFSANYGIEGDTGDQAIDAIRKRQIKNFLVTLLISRGVPMMLGGDEFRRTQLGNNNAYCQDNATSWFDWSYLERHQELFRFARGMIAFRRAQPVLSREKFYTDAEVQWLAPAGGSPDWGNPKERVLGCLIGAGVAVGAPDPLLLILFNGGIDSAPFHLPSLPSQSRWHLAADTSRTSPGDIYTDGDEQVIDASHVYPLEARSSVIFVAR